MLPFAIVVQLDVLEYILPYLIPCSESRIIDQLPLQCPVERLHERVVVRVAFPAVRWNSSLFFHHCHEVRACKLRSLVSVDDQSRSWLLFSYTLQERINLQTFCHRGRHRPSSDLTVFARGMHRNHCVRSPISYRPS